jgi:hypothetical protein
MKNRLELSAFIFTLLFLFASTYLAWDDNGYRGSTSQTLDYETSDEDRDGIPNEEDNCPKHPNGPELGTCVNTMGDSMTFTGRTLVSCTWGGQCKDNEVCQMEQRDYNSNGIGDVCECEGDFDCDGDVDGTDAAFFKTDFGRSVFSIPCPKCTVDNGW